MKKHFIILAILLCHQLSAQQKPNIVYILADDLGFGDIGANGQKIIETPNIDALAKNGINLKQHYAGAPVCAPSRCALLTGKHMGHAYIRGNDEWGERGDVWSLKAMNENPKLEGQRPMPDSILTIAEVLKSKGYTTALVGKWGLGAPYTESTPNKQGFDFFFGYNCQRQAHTLYPTHLWKNEEIVPLKNKFVDYHLMLDSLADPYQKASYANYELIDYAPEVMHKEALAFLNTKHKKPFFLFYASVIPHAPLQALHRWVEYYEKKIGKEEPYYKGKYYPNRTPKATRAAMISNLDEQVGDLVKTLKATGQYNNTLIIFSSDNGSTFAGGADIAYFNSAGPSPEEDGRLKGTVYEGGIRVPFIACWPGKIKAGTESNHISAFYDFYPTVLDIVGEKTKKNDGISYLPVLLGKQQTRHEYLYWEFPEHNGQQAIRWGKWKAIRENLKDGNLHTSLYDLEKDPQELKDMSAQFPDIISQVEQFFKESHQQPEVKRFRLEALGDKLE
ncbi:MAG: arylsulfatase [Sporocytophaga sp.]|uniref:arylsulfatase n=1 Tax=Sporocytophaga sp. TaxID=2231183 RepID=UPI001B2E6781|nr:arylsulfatase [Sporocytophaga sp.]MBO9700344.1 arylsulfatase [Sporocytophaga sp.]